MLQEHVLKFVIYALCIQICSRERLKNITPYNNSCYTSIIEYTVNIRILLSKYNQLCSWSSMDSVILLVKYATRRSIFECTMRISNMLLEQLHSKHAPGACWTKNISSDDSCSRSICSSSCIISSQNLTEAPPIVRDNANVHEIGSRIFMVYIWSYVSNWS